MDSDRMSMSAMRPVHSDRNEVMRWPLCVCRQVRSTALGLPLMAR